MTKPVGNGTISLGSDDLDKFSMEMTKLNLFIDHDGDIDDIAKAISELLGIELKKDIDERFSIYQFFKKVFFV